ncbi:dihydroorotate dehydrogenase [Halodurantibacterium flavum]|uniref:Dihydroorotate dehydrogenase n=1 Tax=Halodurantibacterium flavum TaxID=1382802 RepID=A0ABW4S3H6_9RHOB
MTERNDLPSGAEREDATSLDPFFAAMKTRTPAPGEDLMARILADADRLQPAPPAFAPRRSLRPRWREALSAFGGWQAVTGLVTATVAGLWLGLSPPAAVAGLAEGLWSQPVALELTDQYEIFADLLGEG